MSLLYAPYTEPTLALRDWLRTEGTAAGARVWAGGLPNSPVLPAVVITRAGGGPQGPLDIPLVQFDCWAATGTAAAALVAQLLDSLNSTPAGTALAGAVTYGGTADNPDIVWAPDPESNTPRYVITAQVVTRTVPS